MVETEGVHAAGFFESDFRKTIEAQTPRSPKTSRVQRSFSHPMTPAG
jgi:hypothetical protein